MINDPGEIAEAGIAKLEMTNQLGIKSFREIAAALYKFGCIDNIDKWLGRYSLYNAEKNNIRRTNRYGPGCT